MNNQDVINYVMNTPHNTNPAILNQMLNSRDVSWNDLKDKPFYTETVEEVVMSRIEFKDKAKNYWEGGDGYIPTPFVLNRHYIVAFDGVEYECVGYEDVYGNVCIGNGLLVDRETDINSDMPFGVCSGIDADGDWYTSYSTEVYAEHTIEIRQKVEAVHPIDPKYLPCDLMFKVGCTGLAHPKYDPDNMTKPTIVSGSLEAVLEKLANGEIPVVKVQYQAYDVYSGGFTSGYGGEFTCDTNVYGTDVMFAHDLPTPQSKTTMQITMSTDDPNFMELAIFSYATRSSPLVIS